MSLIPYSSSELQLLALQEFILLKPSKEPDQSRIESTLNILVDVQQSNASLSIIQRGRIFSLRDRTATIADKDDWIYKLINSIRDRGIDAEHSHFVTIKYDSNATGQFDLAQFELKLWPFGTEVDQIEVDIQYIPFTRIQLLNLKPGRQIAQICYEYVYGICETPFQRFFQIDGPERIIGYLDPDIRKIPYSDQHFTNHRKDFSVIFREAQQYQKRSKIDIIVIPVTVSTKLESHEQRDEYCPPFSYQWPNSSKSDSCYVFSPRKMDFSIRFISQIKNPIAWE